jgi:environmental stress-induced protein Ves
MIEVLSAERVPPEPWRNGGGFTRELLAWPSADDWQLRISLAEITRDGAFSDFPGIDRWLAVVEGPGVVLALGARREVLTLDSAPLPFDGAQAPYSELQGGPTRDLNLMARRDAGSAQMLRATADAEWFSVAQVRALFCTAAARLQIDDTDAARLPAFSLAWSTHAARQRWRVITEREPQHALWMSFQPVKA